MVHKVFRKNQIKSNVGCSNNKGLNCEPPMNVFCKFKIW